MEDEICKSLIVHLFKLKMAVSKTRNGTVADKRTSAVLGTITGNSSGMLFVNVVFPDVLLVKVDTDATRTTQQDLSKK